MRYLFLFILFSIFIYVFIAEKKEPQIKKQILIDKVPQKVPFKKKKKLLTAKKRKFIRLIVPSILKVHENLLQRYNRIAQDIKNKKNTKEIAELMCEYHAKNNEDLLERLKPHPVSITLAQAAMESSWGTSRFYKKANNIFGMWSINENEPRIPARQQRDGNKTIWLKKFNTLDAAVRAYYDMMSKGKAYKKFRELRMQYKNPYKITPGLDKYSELGQSYGNTVNKLIKYNEFTRYDY